MKIDLEKFICSLLEEYNFYPEPSEEFKSLINALKQQGLSYKNGKIVEIEPKQEWSEEDEECFNSIAQALSVLLVDPCYDKIKLEHTAWFQSLKDRYTWRPSDEQMKALKEACDEHWEPDGLDPLYTLYQDLKKLIE